MLRTELVLARPSVEPLARLSPKPDPLQPFAAAIGRLRSRARTRASASTCLPASGFRAARLRRRLRREARRIHGERRDWAALLNGEASAVARARPRGAGRAPRGGAGGRREAARLRRAVRGADPPARRGADSGSGEAGNVGPARRLSTAGRAQLPAGLGLPIPGIAFLGSDVPLRRGSFDRRFATGLFRPARKTILTARELAGFLKPPTVHCGERNVLRSGALLSPPPDLPAFEKGREDLIPLGQVSTESGERIVGVQTADTFFTYIAGRSRYGKTETAIAQFVHWSGPVTAASSSTPRRWPRADRALPDRASRERVVRIDLGPGARLPHSPAGTSSSSARRRRGERGAGRGGRRRLRLGARMGRALHPRDQPDHQAAAALASDRRAAGPRAGADDLPDPDAA